MAQAERSRRRVSIALENDVVFHRTMVGRIANKKEIRVRDTGGSEEIGFVTGWDEEWLQLTTTVGQCLVLVNILNITTISETSKNLKNVDVSPQARVKIDRYMETVHVKAKKALELLDGPDMEDGDE